MKVTFEVYEFNSKGEVTGFKVFRGKEQIGTLEYRENNWIGAVIKKMSVQINVGSSVEQVANWVLTEYGR